MAKKQEALSTNPNEICKDCSFWKQFEDECWYHWKEKKFCSMKVEDNDNNNDDNNINNNFEEAKDKFKIE